MMKNLGEKLYHEQGCPSKKKVRHYYKCMAHHWLLHSRSLVGQQHVLPMRPQAACHRPVKAT